MENFKIYIESPPKTLSVLEIAEQAFILFQAIWLVKHDWLANIRLVSSKKVDWNWNSKLTIEELGKEILKVNKDDIKRYNNQGNIDLDFSRIEGFNLIFKSEILIATIGIGSDNRNVVSIDFWDDATFSFEELKSVFRSIAKMYNPSFISAYVPEFLDLVDDFDNGNYRVGWMNYFNLYVIKPPLNFKKAFVEKLESGILFSTVNSFFDVNNPDHFQLGNKVVESFRKYFGKEHISIRNNSIHNNTDSSNETNKIDYKNLIYNFKLMTGITDLYTNQYDNFYDVLDYMYMFEEIKGLDSSFQKMKIYLTENELQISIPDSGVLKLSILDNNGFDTYVLKYFNDFLKNNLISDKQLCLVDPLRIQKVDSTFFLALLTRSAYQKAKIANQIEDISDKITNFYFLN